jgi:hypothetical protein
VKGAMTLNQLRREQGKWQSGLSRAWSRSSHAASFPPQTGGSGHKAGRSKS